MSSIVDRYLISYPPPNQNSFKKINQAATFKVTAENLANMAPQVVETATKN
jgi:hypothetical protein